VLISLLHLPHQFFGQGTAVTGKNNENIDQPLSSSQSLWYPLVNNIFIILNVKLKKMITDGAINKKSTREDLASLLAHQGLLVSFPDFTGAFAHQVPFRGAEPDYEPFFPLKRGHPLSY
jgi:hypothetical protein